MPELTCTSALIPTVCQYARAGITPVISAWLELNPGLWLELACCTSALPTATKGGNLVWKDKVRKREWT